MSASSLGKLKHEDYGVAIICPLEVEMSAVRYMLDEEHDSLPNRDGDSNDYICGRMSGHNVVIASLPQGMQGIGAAAVVATDMKRTFPSAKMRLLVGIGGGVPSRSSDVRLGDVVVSLPTGGHGGVVQYDLGKEHVKGFERKGFLEPPPVSWRTRMVRMQSDHRVRDNQISASLEAMITKFPRLKRYRRPDTEDLLFLPSNEHASGESHCQTCDRHQLINRTSREDDHPVIFYGLIASGNRVVKNAFVRDEIARDAGGALCLEMEAAGLMNDFRCVVIRGICDYADSHKNDDWHLYGAAVAAGCAKEMLTYMEPSAVSAEDRYESSANSSNHRGPATPALIMAAASPSVIVLERALKATQDVNMREVDAGRRTALHIAVVANQAPNVSLLLRSGADVHAPAKDGITPIHLACMMGRAEIVKILITEGQADPNVRDEHMQTPLHAAAVNNQVATVRVLLDHGADPWIAETTGWTAFHIATAKKYTELFQVLEEAAGKQSAETSPAYQ